MVDVERASRVREVVRRTEVTLALGATAASVAAAAVADISLQRGWNSLIAAGLGAVALGGLAALYFAGPVRLRRRMPTAGYITCAVVSLTAAAVVLASDAHWLAEWRLTAAAILATLPNWYVVATSTTTRDG